MDDLELGYLLAVSAAAVWSPRALGAWMRAFQSPRELIRHASVATDMPPAGVERLPKTAIARLASIDDAHALDALRSARSCGASITVHGEPGYPAALDDLCDPPLVLYARGSLECLRGRTMAIVGSRAA